ncbi:MAG: hypothetical protein P8107_12735, partial [Spirochaetia bacterium]
MKIFLFIFLAGICILLPLSCPAPGGGDGLPDYYILFYIDGQRYVFEKGLTDIETVPFAGYWGATHTVIFATPDTGTSADYINSNLSAYIYVGFEDWYENANDTPGQTGEFVLEFLDYYDSGTDTLYQLKF